MMVGGETLLITYNGYSWLRFIELWKFLKTKFNFIVSRVRYQIIIINVKHIIETTSFLS